MIEVHDLRHVPADTVGAWARHLAENLREQDREEVAASSGMDPKASVALSLLLSKRAYAILGRDGDPVAIFGAAPHPLPGVGVVWMLGTDGILTEAHSIARQTRRYMNELQQEFPVLWNYVDERNTVSMRWLKWAGYSLHGERVTPAGHRFRIFARSAKRV